MKWLVLVAALAAAVAAAAPAAAQDPGQGGWPPSVTIVKLEPGKSIQIPSSVDAGVRMQDLSMASCIPASKRGDFRGNTVLFATTLPAHAVLDVHAMPKDPGRQISVFAYTTTADRYDVPDSRATPLSCGWATRSGGPSTTTSRLSIRGGDHAENVVIGVSGPGELVDAPFTLELTLR